MHTREHSSDSMFSFLLLLIFCIFTLLLAGMGASIYKNSTAQLDENYTSRTAIAYTAEKIRQHDRSDSILLTEVEGIPALSLTETINGETFVTYIYYYDNALRELFVRTSTVPLAANGTSIVELGSFSIAETKSSSGTLFEVTACSLNGKERSLLIHPSCS